MRITVSGLNFELTDAIVHYVRERLRCSLGAASGRINDISVFLSDVNGNRGGVDMRCRIVMRPRYPRTIVADAVESDLYAAVDGAVKRVREAVRRHLKRRRTLRRQFAQRRLQAA